MKHNPGPVASQMQNDHYPTAFHAHLELATFYSKPHRIDHHHQNVASAISSGSGDYEHRHVLMDYSAPPGKQQLKSKMMTRQNAYYRNKSLTGTGFAWALCSK